MTKQTDSFRQIGRDRPVLDIEVTPQMIEAGLIAYDQLLGAADECQFVRDVYIAMELQRLREKGQCFPEVSENLLT